MRIAAGLTFLQSDAVQAGAEAAEGGPPPQSTALAPCRPHRPLLFGPEHRPRSEPAPERPGRQRHAQRGRGRLHHRPPCHAETPVPGHLHRWRPRPGRQRLLPGRHAPGSRRRARRGCARARTAGASPMWHPASTSPARRARSPTWPGRGALIGMARVMERELGECRVTVNAVAPAQVAIPGTRAHSGDEVVAATLRQQSTSACRRAGSPPVARSARRSGGTALWRRCAHVGTGLCRVRGRPGRRRVRRVW